MKGLFRFCILTLLILFQVQVVVNGQTKIKLTGTLLEDIEMTIGNSGRKELIKSLPYTFYVTKSELPIRLSFSSDNYQYTNIDVPRKPVDDIGHVYLVKREETFNSEKTHVIVKKEESQKEERTAVDWTKGVNVVPSTGKHSENTFALIIANEEYELVAPVAMANFDGEVFKAYCERTLGLTSHQVKYYPNATYGKMMRAFREIKDIAEAYEGNVNLIIYYAGHGIPDNASKDAYLMPVDADGTDVGVCYSLKNLYKDIESLHVNQCVVFMDACFSGAKRDGDMIVAARGVAIKAKEEKPKSATVVFSATSDEEAAYSYKQEEHGLFTYCLLKKIQESKGNVTLGELAEYLSKNVRQKSIVINGKIQTPTVSPSDDISQIWQDMKLIR